MGLVSHVLDNENFLENVLNLANKMGKMSMYTLVTAKEAIRKAEELGIINIFRD